MFPHPRGDRHRQTGILSVRVHAPGHDADVAGRAGSDTVRHHHGSVRQLDAADRRQQGVPLHQGLGRVRFVVSGFARRVDAHDRGRGGDIRYRFERGYVGSIIRHVESILRSFQISCNRSVTANIGWYVVSILHDRQSCSFDITWN